MVRPQKTSIIVAIIPIFTVRIEAQRAKVGRCSLDFKSDFTDSKFSIFAWFQEKHWVPWSPFTASPASQVSLGF